MDTVLLFALPLVGGLIFCSHCNCTRWRVAREDGHRLYFRAVLSGALIFAFVAALHVCAADSFQPYLKAINWLKGFIEPWAKEKTAAPATADLTIICFLAMLAGLPLAWLLNLVFWKNYWLRRAIRKNTLEAFLLDAADNEDSICVTMDDGKIYVGYLVESFDPMVERKHMKLLPLMSGYREPVTHKFCFTTFYDELYGPEGSTDKTLPLPDLEHLTAEDFIIVLAVERIVSYRKFDVMAYDKFKERDPNVPATPAPLAAPVVAPEAVTPTVSAPAVPDPKQ